MNKMGIIKFFKNLIARFTEKRNFIKEQKSRLESNLKKDIFYYFEPHSIRDGFEFKLEDKEGLMNYLSKRKNEKSKTIENVVYESPKEKEYLKQKGLKEKIQNYTDKIYAPFKKMIEYFTEFSEKNSCNYNHISFNYPASKQGYQTSSEGDKLNFDFE